MHAQYHWDRSARATAWAGQCSLLHMRQLCLHGHQAPLDDQLAVMPGTVGLGVALQCCIGQLQLNLGCLGGSFGTLAALKADSGGLKR